MVASIYKALIQYEDIQGDMVERIRELYVQHVFKPMTEYYGDNLQLFNKALFFILHTYSLNSKYHILGQDWLEIKLRIAERVGINKEEPFMVRKTTEDEEDESTENVLLYTDLILLESPEVVKTIQNYLNFQGNRNFKHLCMLKDQYEQMVNGSLDPIKKSSNDIDFEQKNKNRGYATKILKEIMEWEQKMAEDNQELKDAVEEFYNKTRMSLNSLRVEDNLNKEV